MIADLPLTRQEIQIIQNKTTDLRPVVLFLFIDDYFTGIFSRTALRNSQHLATDGIFARSSGE
jgi:hypothetical protein